MRILIINGSPKGKNSNSLRVTQAFVAGLASEKDEVETIDVEKSNIRGCLGCFHCWGATPGKCVIRDDMNALREEKFNIADVLIWSFPLYAYGIPGKLKCFLDRLLPNKHPEIYEDADGQPYHPDRYDKSKQLHVLISTAGFFTAEKIYDSVTEMFRLCNGDRLRAMIYCAQGGLMDDASANPLTEPYLAAVKKAGAEFAASGRITEATEKELRAPLLNKDDYMKACNAHWKQ